MFAITPQEELTARLTTQLASTVGAAMNGATFIMPDNTIASVTGGILFIQKRNGDISTRRSIYITSNNLMFRARGTT